MSFIDLDVSFGDIGVIGQHMVGYTDETDVMKQAGIADKRDFIGSKALLLNWRHAESAHTEKLILCASKIRDD